MRRHADFWQVTGDALTTPWPALNIDDPSLRDRLMKLYLELDVYPEVKDALKQLKAGGMKLAILSNGAPSMLAAAVANSGISDLMDAVLSVEDVKTYKPHPSVYGLATRRFGVERRQVCFVSSNAWMRTPPRPLAFASSGAIASVRHPNASPSARTGKSMR